MSYIVTTIGTIVQQKELEAKQEKLLSEIRKIVGGKKVTFSDRYLKKYRPNIGVGDRPIDGITKKYVYVSCFLQKGVNEDNTEYGAIIRRFPICYQRDSGSFADKVELEELFISDLERILRELKFYLWWEACIRLPKVKAQYDEVLEYEKKYNKMKNDLGYDPKNDDDVTITNMKMAACVDENFG